MFYHTLEEEINDDEEKGNCTTVCHNTTPATVSLMSKLMDEFLLHSPEGRGHLC